MGAPMNARRYFRRSGILLGVAGLVIALVGVFAAPDTFGRVFAGLMSAIALGGAALRLRRAQQVSPTAVVRETPVGRRVHVEIIEPEQL